MTPQSEEKPHPLLQAIHTLYFEAHDGENSQETITELKEAIRILEAWTEIKRTLKEYGDETRWRRPFRFPLDHKFEFSGPNHTPIDGYEPAQRALALVKGDGK